MDVRDKLLAFINSGKDVPLLAGFSMGIYLLLFYYAANYSLANSLVQLLYLLAYYVVVPMASLFIVYKFIGFTKFSRYKSHALFIGMCLLFSYYILEINYINFSKKRIFAIIVLVSILLSLKFSRYYKLLVLLLFFLSVFNLYSIMTIIWQINTAPVVWQKIPDGIESATFKSRPNIYYLQPDGYTSPDNLKSPIYNFDNKDFENFLNQDNFKVYNSYRSNYYSTLLSNASMFAMKHHYSQSDIDPYTARKVIISDNAVLRTLKHNNYKTHFITERPYLIINRPKMGFDDCNFDYATLPYFMDGWESNRNVFTDFKVQVNKSSKEGNFYFIEKIIPGHVAGNKPFSLGVQGERESYISRVKEANIWLEQMIKYIDKKDPGAIVVIAADHGGFIGFEYLGEAEILTQDPVLKRSMFGALLAIRWNNPEYAGYDARLRTSVNLFRTIFSFLAEDKSYLNNLQKDESYMRTLHPNEVYKYIDANGKISVKQ